MAYLYRVRDAQGALLYVGITENIWGRFLDGHQHSSLWWPDMADLSADWYPDMRTAGVAERAAIAAEEPKWNAVGPGYGIPQPWLGAGDELFEARMARYELACSLIRRAVGHG